MEEKWTDGTFAAPAVRTQLQQAFDLDLEGIVMLPIVESPGITIIYNFTSLFLFFYVTPNN